MKKFKIKYMLFPISILVIGIIIFIGFMHINESENFMYIIPHWEERSNEQKFLEVEYNGNMYSSLGTKTLNNVIGEKIETVVMRGYDVYTKNTYSQNASLYVINTFSKDCVIAVQFENDLNYYVYINIYYRPDTLEDLINDLDLRKNLCFGTISYIDDNNSIIQYKAVEANIIWKTLLNDTTLENVYNQSNSHISKMNISISIPLLGYENKSFSLVEEGYLSANILETGEEFYIGKEKVQTFIDYIINNAKIDKVY